jgi:hypothetical protein
MFFYQVNKDKAREDYIIGFCSQWYDTVNIGEGGAFFWKNLRFLSNRTQEKIFGCVGKKREFSMIERRGCYIPDTPRSDHHWFWFNKRE